MTDEIADTEMWRAYREEQRAQRAARLPLRTQEILALEREGFTVRRVTEFQFRINEAIDLYPTRQRYHVLSTGQRGRYHSAIGIVRSACGGR